MGNTIYYPNGNTSSTSGTPVSNNTSTSYVNLLINMLQTGLSISNGDGAYCCPECTEGETKIYFLASIPKAIQILNGLGYQQGDSLNCCLNISSSTSTPAFQYLNSLFKYQCCPNNFNECVNELTSKLGAACCNELQQIGIVEYGTLELTTTSPFCTILTNLLKVAPALSPKEICDVYKEILNTGIIFKCDGCNITIEKGPDFGTCYCYKVTVPIGITGSVTSTCQGIPVIHSNLTTGDYYYCSELMPSASNPSITFEQLADCALVPCTSPPPPCICYEFTVLAPQPADIPVQLSCNGELTIELINQGVYRFCSDSYPIVSPEVQVTTLNDCESGPCISPPPPACGCYIVYNPTAETCSVEYTDCNANLNVLTTLAAGNTIYVCAIVNTVVGNCPTGSLVITQQPNNGCDLCVPPPPAPCVCYYIELSDPNNQGLAPTCIIDHTDCTGNPVSTSVFNTGYICSQTIPINTCKGINMNITVITLGDCNNSAVGCPPMIL